MADTIKGGSKNYHRRYTLRLDMTSCHLSILFSVQSASSAGHNACIAPFLTYTLTSKRESKSVKANF